MFEFVECLRSGPLPLRLWHAFSDAGIFLAYLVIPIVLVWIYRSMRARPEARLLYQFGAFIILCGCTHLMSVITLEWPIYWASAALKTATALVSLSVMIEIFRRRHQIVALGGMAGELLAAVERERGAAVIAAAALIGEKEARAESDRLASERASQLAVLESRDRIIQELTSPILHHSPGLLIVPLVGVVDSARASELQERLGLLCERQAARVILDLTGVDAIDTAVAAHLHGMTRFVQYLGGQCIVTGMRAAVAQALVGLGIDLQIRTYNTLADGIAAATGKQ